MFGKPVAAMNSVVVPKYVPVSMIATGWTEAMIALKI